MQTILNLPNKQ